MEWDPVKYAEFGDYRDRPFFDLTGRIRAEHPRLVVDLGCGPGTLTAALARRWPQSRVLGVDSSPRMVDTARAMVDAPANLSFDLADIARWQPEPGTDVVVSNAALQWVPGHRELMAAWLAALEPGAWLAVQVPGNFGAPSHALMRQLAASPRWRRQLDGVLRHDDVAGPADYLQVLLEADCAADAWETTYLQLLPRQPAASGAGHANPAPAVHPVLEWVRGTGLRPVLAALEAADADEFERDYAALLAQAYPSTSFGTVFPFRRLFCVGEKK